jgi:hypothetical protein
MERRLSPAYRIAVITVGLAYSCTSFAADKVSAPDCASGVCVLNILAAELISAPCVGYSVLVAYSQSSGATLLQCSQPGGGEENKSFIYDRRVPELKPLEFSGGRFIRPDYLATAETQGIPDRFGPVPLCAVKGREAAAPGELLIAERQPSSSDTAPYCYRINYVIDAQAHLTIRRDDGKEISPLSEKAAAQWARMKEKLSPYIDPGQAGQSAKPQRMATVSSDKAPLFSSPHPAATTRMYLVKGDKVEVLDGSKLDEGWLLIRYVTRNGRVIEKWVAARDLDEAKN